MTRQPATEHGATQQPATQQGVGSSAVVEWLAAETSCSEHAARQAVEYVAAQQAAVGLVPTQTQVIFERFFDESGGMQLVVHAPFGGRINRAWGLAMRKRFCRSYDFELQASADDDGFILSLGPQHSFPIESLFPMLRVDNVRSLLEQALLAVPLFHLRWRWNVTRSLLVARMRNGKKVPPAIQRFRSEDLLTAVFPKLTGCQEEHTGDHVIPDHPLVNQTMRDCLTEALDLDGLLEVLGRVERGEITFIARDTREPSPFAYELLNANPYAFLDGGEVQERRARAVATRRTLSIDTLQDLGRLDPRAIAQVVAEAQPSVRDADELHDVLLSRILLADPTGTAIDCEALADWSVEYAALEASGRAATLSDPQGRSGWVAAERMPAAQLLWPLATCAPLLAAPAGVRQDWTAIEARVAAVRGLMEVAGPLTGSAISERIGLSEDQANAALEALEGEGVVLRGQFTPAEACAQGGDAGPPRQVEWCHRRLLARIHRLTVAGLRREIEPVDVPTFLRFLTHQHGLVGTSRPAGTNGLYEVISRLQGLDLPAVVWEEDILARRIEGYQPSWLDELCLTGEVGWGRLYAPPRDPERSRPLASITRLVPVSLFLRDDMDWLLETAAGVDEEALSTPAADVLSLLRRQGALFATDLLSRTRLLPGELDEVIGELVSRGFLTADGFAGLRAITRTGPVEEEPRRARRRTRSLTRRRGAAGVGRWSLWRPADQCLTPDDSPGEGSEAGECANTGSETASGAVSVPSSQSQAGSDIRNERSRRREVAEAWAWQLLRRWSIVFRDLLGKEPGAPAWWELVQVFRRLEARGEIRGGRFVAGVAGEQFAMGDTVGQLRRLREEGRRSGDELLTLSACDPLNLVGILTPHPRLASRPANAFVLLNGKPVARIESGQITLEDTCPSSWRERVLEHARTRVDCGGRNTEPAEGDATAAADEPLTDRHAQRFERRRENGRRMEVPKGIPKPLV